MKYHSKGIVLFVIFITGCSDIKIEKQCFTPIHYQAEALFQSSDVRVEPIWVGHSRNDYLIDHNVSGYLSSYGTYERISSTSQLILNGSIYKVTPSLAERYIGRSSERLLFEVSLGAKKYVISDKIPEHIVLPERCYVFD